MKLTENLRVRAVSENEHKKRQKVQREKDEIGECGWRWPNQRNNPPMPCVVNFYFRQTEQLGKTTENGSAENGSDRAKNHGKNGKSASLIQLSIL